MNSREKILLDITAYVDKQCLSQNERIAVEKQIEDNLELEIEYKIQQSIKNLVSKRIDRAKTPAYLIDSIVTSTVDSYENNSPNGLIVKIKELLSSPKYLLATATTIILFGVIYSLINFNNSSIADTPNMFVQAEQNFFSIISGDLKPQKLCKTSAEVQDFFKTSGVSYKTIVPEFAEWDLVGAVVSEERGQKLAHHVYADASGHLIYLYQVNKAHFGTNKLLELSPEILDNLMRNKVVKFQSANHSSFLFKCESNIFALVSNDDDLKVEKTFINDLIQRNTI